MRQAQGVVHARRFDLRAAHDRAGQASARAHADGDIARHLLGPDVADRGRHDGGVIGGVDHCQRRGRRLRVEEKGRHLNLGEGAAHTVAVDGRYARLQAANQGLHRIGAADFGDGDRVKAAPDMRLQQAQRPAHLRAFGQLLDADGWRANAADNAAEGIVRQVEGVDDRLRPPLADDRGQVQAAQIGVAAAARAQDAGADGDGANVFQRYLSQHQRISARGIDGCR